MVRRKTYVEDDATLPLEVVQDVIKDWELDHVLVAKDYVSTAPGAARRLRSHSPSEGFVDLGEEEFTSSLFERRAQTHLGHDGALEWLPCAVNNTIGWDLLSAFHDGVEEVQFGSDGRGRRG